MEGYIFKKFTQKRYQIKITSMMIWIYQWIEYHAVANRPVKEKLISQSKVHLWR